MKTRKRIFIVLGVLCILFQVLGYLGGHINVPEDPSERIGYYIGYHFFGIVGLIFLLIARSVDRKMKRKAEQKMLDDFLK